jgi:acetyl-CoA C-acetyltransferase
VGVEKLTDRIGSAVEAALAAAADADFEAVQGLTPAAQAALLMRRYIHEHDVPEHGFASFGITAHANAVANPRAMYRRAIKPEDYASAPMLSDPINLFDAAPVADGAAALLLTRGDGRSPAKGKAPVRVVASAIATGPLALHDQPDPLGFEAAAISARRAMTQAGVAPDDVDLFELHDVFSIYAALALESAGFAERGRGWLLAAEGEIGRSGRIPISTMGGSKARGDAGGATGVYQVAEVVLQLQGRAGEAQVPEARVGMAQCLGGAGATVATHILIGTERL